jgi:uncharacterized membrane protein
MPPQNEKGFFSNEIWIFTKRCGGCSQVEKVHFEAPSFWISICNALKVLHFLQLEVLCLIGFELWYHGLLHFICVVFVICVISRTMKQKSLKLVARSIAKSKPALLQYFFSNRNVSNVKPL